MLNGWLFIGVSFPLLILALRGLRVVIFGRKNRPPATRPNCCVCGYSLDKLAVARCPECGRVRGFEATAEQLGLNDQQLARVKAAQDRRDRSHW